MRVLFVSVAVYNIVHYSMICIYTDFITAIVILVFIITVINSNYDTDLCVTICLLLSDY